MKILVTGASGFLGGALVRRLLAGGARDVRCLVRPGSSRARLEALARAYPDAHVELFEGSLASAQDAAPALAGVDLVHHLAAGMSGATADMFLNTVVTSKHLLDALIALPRRPRVVLVSSFSVYGAATLPRGALIDEASPIEPQPERRDPYAQAKLRQEKLFWEYRSQHGLQLTVLRPGVIYGPGGTAISSRVGLSLAGAFLFLGGDNILPLSQVDNCAHAIEIAGARPDTEGQIYNVVDDDLPTCRAFLDRYQREVQRLRTIPIPYATMQALSFGVERYHQFSRGQLPAIFTPYRTATTWGGNRFDNQKLKGLGWQPLVSTDEGLRQAFAHFRAAIRP